MPLVSIVDDNLKPKDSIPNTSEKWKDMESRSHFGKKGLARVVIEMRDR